jgi:SAM-dependent methyltransferase
MRTIGELRTTLRTVDPSHYPELSHYSKRDIWRATGPGGLYLISLLARALELQPGAWVLDLGCGAAESSLYLAENYGASVIAADLRQAPEENAKKIEDRGHRGSIIPMRLDAAQPLPFPEGYFDAILCVNSLSFFGTDMVVLDRIARHLKVSGLFCSGGECLNEEFSHDQLADPPSVYDFAEQVWEEDFLKLHSPGWWADHVARSSELELVSCQELEDGQIFYEEQALVSEPEAYLGLTALQARELEIRQIEYGRQNRPYMTVYQLVARRR